MRQDGPPVEESNKVRYDQLGNRKEKLDAATAASPAYYTAYTYDTDFPDPQVLDFPTRNNRLLWYTVQKDGPSGPTLRTVRYTYYKTGDASNITVKDYYIDATTMPGNVNDYAWHNDLALYYFRPEKAAGEGAGKGA